jgi:hypothetical protein
MRSRDFWRMRKAAMRLGWIPANANGEPCCELCNSPATLRLVYLVNEPIDQPDRIWACEECVASKKAIWQGGGR